jgi:type I restriction enzyme M protein
MNTATIVQKLWNYCNVLRDDGMSYGDYVEATPVRPAPAAFEHPCSAQLTFALTLTLSRRERGDSYDGDEMFDHYQDQAGRL